MIILALGTEITPYLAEKITNQVESKWIKWASVGDVAHILLTLIYNRDWPTSDFEKAYNIQVNESFHIFHKKYFRNINNLKILENRKNLQKAWIKAIEKYNSMISEDEIQSMR